MEARCPKRRPRSCWCGILVVVAAVSSPGLRSLLFGPLEEAGYRLLPALVARCLLWSAPCSCPRGARVARAHMRWDAPADRAHRVHRQATELGVGSCGTFMLIFVFGPLETLRLIMLGCQLRSRSRACRACGLQACVLLGLVLHGRRHRQDHGEERLRGLEQLSQGFDLVVAPGLSSVAEYVVSFQQRSCWRLLATLAGWRDPASNGGSDGMRAVAALVIAASCYLIFRPSRTVLGHWTPTAVGAFGDDLQGDGAGSVLRRVYVLITALSQGSEAALASAISCTTSFRSTIRTGAAPSAAGPWSRHGAHRLSRAGACRWPWAACSDPCHFGGPHIGRRG